MSKYVPLTVFLKSTKTDYLPMTFVEIERVLGFRLPASAHDHPAWWANDDGPSHVQAKAWLLAGFETQQIDRHAKHVVFKRMSQKNSGMSDGAREFKHADGDAMAKSGPHPLIGALEGTFSIEPGYDLTRPTLDPEELDQIDANIERTADLIDEGFSGKSR
jgi:hypothetical protein